MPEAVGDIGGLRLIGWAFALYLMGSIVAATAVSAYAAGHDLRRTMMVSTLIYTLGCIIYAAAPAMPVLLAGRTVQGLGGGALVARDSAASCPSRLLPGHATDLSHPVGSGIAMTFVIGLCMMSFCVYGPILTSCTQ